MVEPKLIEAESLLEGEGEAALVLLAVVVVPDVLVLLVLLHALGWGEFLSKENFGAALDAQKSV
jgi:hypothetical protein